MKNRERERGFSVVEVLLAATVLGMITTAMIGSIVYGRQSASGSGDRQRATQLAQEGIEAARSIANASYANLTVGTHGIVQSAGAWAFSGTSDTSGIYTRQVVVASAGTNRESVNTTVTWPQAGGTTGSVTLTDQIANWEASIKQWSSATVAGTYTNGTTSGYRVDTQGNYAYLIKNVSGATNLFIINISNPASPTLSGSLTLANTPTDIFVSGNYAYVANSSTSGELQIVDVSNPAAPALKSTFNAQGTAGGGLSVFVSGNYAYLGRAANSGNAELTIVNISNPLSPSQTGIYSNNLAMNQVIVVPGATTYAYVATNNTSSELLIINVTNPAAPVLTKAFNTSTSVAATSVQVIGNNAFVLEGSTLTYVDITNRSLPIQQSTYTMGTTTGAKMELDITGVYLFIATNSSTTGVDILNVSNPSNMSFVGGTSSTVNGISYDSSLDLAVGARGATSQQLVIVRRGP